MSKFPSSRKKKLEFSRNHTSFVNVYLDKQLRITKIPISALIIFRQLMGFFEWGANIAERLAFAELLATGEDFTSEIWKTTYKLFGFEENETATLEGYMQDYFGRILRKLKELSDEKEKSL